MARARVGPDMAVVNPFTGRLDDRVEVLRAVALVGSLAGVGAAGALFAITPTFGTTLVIGLLATIALGFSLAARVWLREGWQLAHTGYAFAAGATWIIVGFVLPPAVGAIPVVLGASLVGVGLAGAGLAFARPVMGMPRPR